jgi:hypothetical protein
MLATKQLNCESCMTYTSLIEDIDCKLTKLSKDLYNNVIFALNNPVNRELFIQLMTYRRILNYRIYNSDYASPFTDEQITSRVKLLKFK